MLTEIAELFERDAQIKSCARKSLQQRHLDAATYERDRIREGTTYLS